MKSSAEVRFVIRRVARIAASIAAIFISGAWQQSSLRPASTLPDAHEINAILQQLSEITGFKIKRELPFEMVTRDQVNQFLKDQIRRTIKPEEIEAEEITLKKFGFVPPDFDLKRTTIDLLTEQAAAFYDFHRKKLFISDWATENMRDAALVHELAHALADENFPIQKFLDQAGDNSEESLARQTVVEGQASWLMLEFAARRIGKSLADPATAREYLSGDSETNDNDGEYPVFSKAPLYLKETLMFPYEAGQNFQQAIFLRDGKAAFSRVFRQPPLDTAQILHPARYFDGVKPLTPELPRPIKHSKAYVTGILGELDERILLRQYIDRAAADEFGPKLLGANYRIDKAKPNGRLMLLYASQWSDADSASGYFRAYQTVLRKKWKRLDVISSSADRVTGKADDGYFLLRRDGSIVLSEEGFGEPL
jgi:hypothetical protein